MRTIILLFLFSFMAYSQDFTLEECYKLAYDNSPLLKSSNFYNNSKFKKLLNADAGYYPEFNISAQAKYQSDVLELPIKIPTMTIPEIPKDNYQIVLNVNQVIWDGFAISSQKDLIIKQSDLENSNLEIELYKLKERVNLAYFGILSLNKKLNLLNLTIMDLESKLSDLDAKIKSGIALNSNYDYLKSEKIKLESSIFEVNNNINSFKLMLKNLTGKDIYEIKDINIENISIPDYNISERLEFKSFNNSKDILNANKNLIDAKYMPKFFAFAQAGYAKPGLNMFDPDFAPYYIVGIKASWNPWSWGSQEREKELLEIQQEMIKIQEENFKKNLEYLVINEKNEIDKAKNNIKMDDEIIILKKNILLVSNAKFDGGIITAVEYFNDLTALRTAEMNKEVHKIDLAKYINSYKTTLGVK